MKKRVNLKVFGNVQGVFFRAQIKKKAEELRLVGWARNESDGTVKIVAEGEEKLLKDFINWCYNGVLNAQVEKVDIEWQEVTGEFGEFEIRYR